MESLVSDFILSISLIMAIGAQNAFVLKQGIKKHHVFWVCLVCAVSDAILIVAGIAGFGAAVEAFPALETGARYGGAAFLIAYGIKSLLSAFGPDHSLEPEGEVPDALAKTIAMTLAFTWLNPHVYLDTVVLIGSISAQYDDRLGFALGAMTSSFVFFFSLGYGASILSPVFARPRAWQVLDAGIGVVMLGIALKLVTM